MRGNSLIEGKSEPFYGWRMVILCCLILNVGLGVNFSAYGALVAEIQKEFQTSRALAALGPSLLNLTMGVLSPFVGVALRRISLKLLMLIGVAMNGGGYLLIMQADSVGAMLACYALLIGPGFCLVGAIPCTMVVSNWFVEGRGKALGFINIPVGSTIMPIVAAFILQSYGLQAAFLTCGLLLLALTPLVLALIDRPDRIGQQPRGGAMVAAAQGAQAGTMTTGQIFRFAPFWVLTIGASLLSAGGVVMVVHLVSMGVAKGLSLSAASVMLSAFGLAGFAGAPMFGWLSDRIGSGRSFALLCFGWILPWLALLVVGGSMPILLLIAVLIGLFSNGINTLFSATMSNWLGAANVSAGLGLSYMFKLPFLFGAGVLAGATYDATGGYTVTILLHVSTFLLVGLTFLFYRPRPVEPASSVAG